MALDSARRARRAGTLLAVTAALGVAPAAPAFAGTFLNSSTAVDQQGAISGLVQGYQDAQNPVVLELIRGGVAIASGSGVSGTEVRVVPQAGDELRLTDTVTSDTYNTIISGRPTFDAAVCGATALVSGTRDPDAVMDAGATIFYGTYDARNETVPATITSASGDTFAGTFPHSLGAAWRVLASQTRAINPNLTVYSSFSRKVGACPPDAPAAPAGVAPAEAVPPSPSAPPATPGDPAPVAPDRRPPAAKLAAPKALFTPAAAFRALSAGALTTSVVVDEPGTVEQTLYLDDGATLPTATKAAKSKKKANKPTVLGKGRALATKPGAVKVRVKLSQAGKSRISKAKTIKLALVTRVRDTAGNLRTLPVKRFSAKRTAVEGHK
ncbi:MAG TPA: hypothetical protein VK501_01860 [Baekduia sp.]|uniref:hypothetical protein n=1 Tax=Baekduia sp. TaxID=2600305 RepID=UPI002C39D663|nr:hypothetical protein [Baekduia sp.]HMJ32633.1 hypothetical protein [Baekduia sp.]